MKHNDPVQHRIIYLFTSYYISSAVKKLSLLYFEFSIVLAVFMQAGYCGNYSDSTGSKTYFLDSAGGVDSLSGLSQDEAWKSLDRANQVTYKPGDRILFKRGGTWDGIFEPKGSGAQDKPIVISAYGTGEKPVIDARGTISDGQEFSSTLRLFNQEYWEIKNIHIRNYAPGEEISPQLKYGILVEGRDIGTLHGFTFRGLEISDVNGSLDQRENGGLCMLISRSDNADDRIPSNFDGILVDSCYFYNTSRSGFFTVSEWKTRDLLSRFGEKTVAGSVNEWYPSFNIIVRNCSFDEIGGNGLVIRVAESPLVEHNYFYKCGVLTTGNASYPYNCNNALWQFNEACYTDYEEGDVDASGFDSDYFCKNTIIQYNYSHDNEWGSVLICNNGTLSRAFNDGTIVRYNVFQNDGHHSIRVSGTTSNTYVYNNLIYVGEGLSSVDILWHKSWGGFPDKTNYFNNIIYNNAPGSNYRFGSSTNNVFSNNLFYGLPASNEPADPKKITSDPLLVAPGGGQSGFQSLEGYKLQHGSPAIDAGKSLVQGELRDFFGNQVPCGNGVDIGVHESQEVTVLRTVDDQPVEVTLSPNPATNLTILNIYGNYIGSIGLSCIDSSGIVLSTESFSKNGIMISRVFNLEQYATGTYFLKIVSDRSVQTLKLIKL
jgi:hypothetical protein